MKATLDLRDDLLAEAKAQAAQERTMTLDRGFRQLLHARSYTLLM